MARDASDRPWTRPEFKKILVAIDGSPSADNALAWAAEIAKLHRGSVRIVHVLEPPTLTTAFLDQEYDKEGAKKKAQGILDTGRKTLAGHRVDAKAELLQGPAVRVLTKVTRKDDIDLLVLGSQGFGAARRALLGSVADGVKNHVPCSVLIAKGPPAKNDVVVPVDGSVESRMAAAVAIPMARAWGVRCTVLSVLRKADAKSMQSAIARVGETLPKLNAKEWKEKLVVFDVLQGHPVNEILKTADRDQSDLIAMGSRGLSGIRSLVPGSVSNRVAHRSKASILLVKRPKGSG